MTPAKNWAEEYGDTVETRSEWRQHNRQHSAQKRAERKALKERDWLYRQWRKWHEKQLVHFLNGPYAVAANELDKFLSAADLDSGKQLIELVKSGPWLHADDDSKYQALRMIDHAIIYMREKNGLVPFDDALDDNLNVFQRIRKYLYGW